MRSGLNLSKLAAAMMAVLVVMLPFATANALTGWVVEGAAAFGIEASIPQYSHSSVITVEGMTAPLAAVHVFVNNARQRVGNAAADGSFRFTSISVVQGENKIRLEAHKNDQVAQKEYTLVFDNSPPVVRLDREIPASTKNNSITVSGDVSEKVTIKWRVIHKTDSVPPDIVNNLRVNRADDDAIELAWDPGTAADIKEYLVERSGKRIAAVSLPSYRDTGLKSGSQYTYSVSAVDTSCNIGTSAELAASTKSGKSNATAPFPESVNLSCETPWQVTSAGSPFSLTIPLTQGANDLEIIFEDSAGNRQTIRQTVLMDTLGPRFLETNLGSISPSYIPDITIKGRLDEQATVFVYINDEKTPSEHKVTEPDGSFSIKVRLRTDVRIKTGAQRTTVEAGEGWANKIRLEAVDLSGNKASYGPVDVDFLLCGSGTWWIANVGEALPDILMPRLMVQGIQQIGIPFNITYVGGYQAKLGRIDVRPIALAADASKDYDHDWIQVSSFTRAKGPKDTIGYIQVQFTNVDPLPDKPGAGSNEKEVALSGHRRGECLVPGTGCVKLFLQMRIQFQEIIQLKPTDPRMPIVTPKIETRVQNICIPVEVAIDQTIPNDVIPEGMLRNTVKLLGNMISLIDKVLNPLTTIGEYALYGCLASAVWMMYNYFSEKMACDVSSVANKFNKAVAEAGMCEQAYKSSGGGSDKTGGRDREACTKCQNVLESRKKFEMNVMNAICDRVGCPSAPTFATYIKDNAGNAVALAESASVKAADQAFYSKWAVKDQIFSGNDCAFTGKEFNYISPTYSGVSWESAGSEALAAARAKAAKRGEPPEESVEFRNVQQEIASGTYKGRLGIGELYKIAKGESPVNFPSGPKKEDCKKLLHPAHPNCCGIQYQKDWSSACGVGTVLGEGLDTFDELGQSTCLSAQQANSEDLAKLGCNQVWNAVAGFCESNTGEPEAQPVRVEARWEGPLPARPGADNNDVFLFVVPRNFTAGRLSFRSPSIAELGGGGTATGYSVYSGYVAKTVQFQGMSEQEAGVKKANQLTLRSGLTAALETDVTRCFEQQTSVKTQAGKTQEKLTEEAQIKCLYDALCEGSSPSGYTITPCQLSGNIRQAWKQVYEIVGTPEKTYIVEPKSGMLRSIQCICLPAVIGYLQMWRGVLNALHGCFSKILLTGEGSEGFCEAKLSGTICDLFYEVITCFTQKFNTPGVGMRLGLGGFDDVLSAITGAGTAVTKSINQRYGDSPLFRSLFSERKLVHAICIWAFTGTWDLNVRGLFQEQVEEMPLDTSAALTTCERTFISYDPTTDPSGLTTWAYRIAGGLIAGADVRYWLKLKCSPDFSCDLRDYPNGKCDCYGKEQVMTVSAPDLGTGLAKKYDFVSFDAPFVVSPQNSYANAGYRYDTAILEWEWMDPMTRQMRTGKAECSIRETGGAAPAFCALDAFSGKFRCLFGEQESGIKILSAKAVLPANQPAFALTDKLNFSLEIKQKISEDRRFQSQGRKFLTYEIRDAANRVVDGLLPDGTTKPLQITNEATSLPYELSTNGVYTKLVPEPGDDILGRFEVNEETIARHSITGARAAEPEQAIWPVISTKKFVTFINVKEGFNPAANNYTFLINFPEYGKPTAAESKYEVWQINPAAPKLEPDRNGYMRYAVGNVLASGYQSPDVPVNHVSFNMPGALTAAGVAQTVSVSIDFSRAEFNNVNALQLLVKYVPVKEGPVEQGCNPNTVVSWKAVFTLYDANSQGTQTDQISTDPETGEQQQKTVDFKVRCAKKEYVQSVMHTITELNEKPKGQVLLITYPNITANKDVTMTFVKLDSGESKWEYRAYQYAGDNYVALNASDVQKVAPIDIVSRYGSYKWEFQSAPAAAPAAPAPAAAKTCAELNGTCGIPRDDCITQGYESLEAADCECCKMTR